MIHITHIYPRFKKIHGGGEPVLIHLLNQLTFLGYKNTLHTCDLPDKMRHLIDERVSVKTPPKLLKKKFSHFLLQGFWDLMASSLLAIRIPEDCDVICFHTEGAVPALLVYKLFVRKKPCIYFCFQPPRFAYDTSKEIKRFGGIMSQLLPCFSGIYRPFDRYTVRLADKVLTFSTGYKKWIESIYDIKDVLVIPCGVKKPDVIPALSENISAKLSMPGTKTIIFAGKLIAQKNTDRLINIISIVKKRVNRIKCLIVGDGPCMESLRKQAGRMGLDGNIIFCGYVDSHEVFAYYSAADLFVILEKNVSFGLSIIEAHSCGLPALAFEGGGPSDIIEHGKNGFLQSPQNTDTDIANQIVEYLTNEEMMQRMRRTAGESSLKYTWQNFATTFADIATGMSKCSSDKSGY